MKALHTHVLPIGRALASASVTTAMLARVELLLAATAEEERAELFDAHLRRWAALQLRLLGIELRLDGEAPPPTGRPRLIVASHRAAVDIFVAQALFGGRILSRADVAAWPVLGKLAERTGTIFVDRSSRASGASALRQIRRHLKEGATITVFPEGTTYRGDEVRPFSGALFAGTSSLGVELVPVGFAYPEGVEYWQESFVSHIQRVAGRTRTTIGVAVGQVQVASGKPAAIAERMHAEVQRLVHLARARASQG